MLITYSEINGNMSITVREKNFIWEVSWRIASPYKKLLSYNLRFHGTSKSFFFCFCSASNLDHASEKVFVRDGSQGSTWLKARITVEMTSDYYILIRHTRGTMSVETGVAIDDIKFSTRACCKSLFTLMNQFEHMWM